MLQRIHNILAWITINNSTQLSIYALKLQTKLTTRYPHLNGTLYTEAMGAYSQTLVNGVPIK